MKYRSRAPKGMSRTIAMQAFTLAAMTDAEKKTQKKLRRKN